MGRISGWMQALRGEGYTYDIVFDCVKLASTIPAAGSYPHEVIEALVYRCARITTYETWWSKPDVVHYFNISPVTANRVPTSPYNNSITVHDTVDKFDTLEASTYTEALQEYVQYIAEKRTAPQRDY